MTHPFVNTWGRQGSCLGGGVVIRVCIWTVENSYLSPALLLSCCAALRLVGCIGFVLIFFLFLYLNCSGKEHFQPKHQRNLRMVSS